MYKSTKSKKGMNALQLFFNLVFFFILYLIASMCLYWFTGIKLPEPYYNPNPHTVVFTDPSYNPQKYNYNVDPEVIQNLLDHHPYNHTYQANVFDCSNMSMETARYLQEDMGYDTSVIGDDVARHAWVFVWTGKNSGFAIETTSVTNLMRGSAGEVVGDDWWDTMLSPDTVNPSIGDLLSEKDIAFHYPTIMRPTLHLLEWNDPSLALR